MRIEKSKSLWTTQKEQKQMAEMHISQLAMTMTALRSMQKTQEEVHIPQLAKTIAEWRNKHNLRLSAKLKEQRQIWVEMKWKPNKKRCGCKGKG